ncbi:hypothetical protein FER63_23375 [Salmonella enterica]|nr:hypothetical protein [Salmonella enterica]
MKNKEIFEKYFKLDANSPTGVIWKDKGTPAGAKETHSGYEYWYIKKFITVESGKPRKKYKWAIPKTIYELTHGVELTHKETVIYLDGNSKNFHPDNLAIISTSQHLKGKGQKWL